MRSGLKFACLAAVAAGALTAGRAGAQEADIKVGFIGGITGPIESMAPAIQAGAKLAVDQANQGGGLSSGGTFSLDVGDTGCIDAAKASDVADRVINSDGVVAIVGALCSGATIAAANSAAIPAGVVMVSPASTSPAVTALDDNDLVFRTAASDAYQGEVLARVVQKNGIDNVAVTYVNNDYGKGFAEAFQAAFEAEGGTILASEAHEDGKADYRAEIGSLASTGAEALIVLAYVDGSGGRIAQQAMEAGDFDVFVGGDGMVGPAIASVPEGGSKLILTHPGSSETPGTALFSDAAKAAGFDPGAVYAATSYDATFALLLALEKTGGKKEGLSDALREVSTEPGETILPGEWEKAVKLISEGTDINYEGASGSLEFDDNGDVPGVYNEVTYENGEMKVIGPAN
ncbi:ABC transporter substrate-binding protein [Consotaella aegiceratis]|uniref:ABC transporter substrate-binding protein n=1 Tax=Consotaella aegiceratis TaxID=3097961 RepID=UPI002F41EEEC